MPKSFLFTHRRYDPDNVAEPTSGSLQVPSEAFLYELNLTDKLKRTPPKKRAKTLALNQMLLQQSPVSASPVPNHSPERPTTTAMRHVISNAIAAPRSSPVVPDELFNLRQLADISLAAAAAFVPGSTGVGVRRSLMESFHERADSFSHLDVPLNLSTHDAIETTSMLTPSPSASPSPTHSPACSPSPRTRSNNNTSTRKQTYESITSSDENSSEVPCNLSIKSTSSSRGSSSIKAEHNHICPDCNKSYSTSSNLARHRQIHRSPADQKARRCPHCDKVYVSVPAFSMHVRTHSQGCKCPFCGKGFSRPWLLQGHIRTHTGEKPFRCHVCDKAFADKSNLRAHLQTHSNAKPFTCQRCGKAFALKSYLYKHEESSCMRLARAQNSEATDAE